MNTLNKLRTFSILLAASSVLLVSCNDDDEDDNPPTTPPESGNIVINSNITSNTTWTSDNVYQLGTRVTVLEDVTLTIEPGTIIKGEAGSGPNATALLVARGGTLIADGTPEAPIIFTSVADEMTPEDVASGNFASPNLDPNIAGLWGGVIVLGRAPISASNDNGDVSEIQIEGIPTSDSNGLYGGNEPADNSGVIRYISIRHGGSNIGAGNEINGLTLGGVGSETIVENIEVVANADDGVEWFGGTVNTSNVVVWNCNDDGIDTDQSWAGTLNNFVVIGVTGHAFELDGPEGSFVDGHTITNGSVKMSYEGRITEDVINTDDNSVVDLENIYFTDLVEGQAINRVDHEEGVVNYTNILLNIPAEDVPDYVNGDVPAGVTNGTTPQADISGFGWTWTSQAGAMSGL